MNFHPKYYLFSSPDIKKIKSKKGDVNLVLNFGRGLRKKNNVYSFGIKSCIQLLFDKKDINRKHMLGFSFNICLEGSKILKRMTK